MKVVLTGGPCAGKSSLLGLFAEMDSISVVREAATNLLAQGWQSKGQNCGYSREWKVAFQVAVLEAQLLQEERAMQQQPGFIICDRGISDGPAYLHDVPAAEYNPLRFLATFGNAPGQYQLIIHLTSLAITQPELYGNKDNLFRTESADDARRIDDLIWSSWEATRIPHVRINTSKKLSRVFDETLDILQSHKS